MQYEGESSVVQVIFAEKKMVCVVHPSSVLPEFSSSRNQQSLMSVSFWVCFQVVFTGLSVTGVAFQYGRGRERSIPTLIYAAEVSRNVRLLVYCDKLSQTNISAFPPGAAQQKRVTKQSVPIYSLTGARSTAPDREKKITWLNRASAGMTYPRDWEKCLRSERREHVLPLTAV